MLLCVYVYNLLILIIEIHKVSTIAIVINYSFFGAPLVHQWVLGSFPNIYFKATFCGENDFSETTS